MKPNPLYYFLYDQNAVDVIYKLGYIMVSLSEPKIRPTICLEGRNAQFSDHHLSIHEAYEEGTQYNSLFHYTANFDGFVVHVYFNRNGEQSEAYFKEKTEDYKAIAQPLPEAEKAMIDQLMLNFSTPMGHRLNELHADKIKALSTPYYQGLLEIRDRLFDQTMDVDGNLSIMRNLIDLGESLNRINYHTREHRVSLIYLKKQHAGILKLKDAIVSDISDASPLTSAFADEAHDNADMIEPIYQKFKSAVQKPEENVDLLCQSFETSYDKINTHIQSYDTLPFNDFSGKVKILDDASPALLHLLIEAESLMGFDPALIHNPMVLYKSGPGLDFLFNACKNKGTLLLTLCLLSTKERLQTFGTHLTDYASFVSSDCVDSALRKGNVDALFYLIKHGSVAINRHQVTFAGEKTMLSLVCGAYRLGQLECFAGLIKHNANVFVLYEDELPLAHTLFNLPVSNPYRQAFIEHSPYFPDKTSQFFSIIMPMLQDKLLFDSKLTPKQRAELNHSLALYEMIIESGNITASSKGVTRQATQLSQRLDQNVLEDLRASPAIPAIKKSIAK